MSASEWRRLPASVDTASSLHARAEALLDAMTSETPPTLAWSQASPRALVLGRAAGEAPVDPDAARTVGVAVVSRRSGGGPVLWDNGLLGLDVWLPRGHPLAPIDVVETYRWLGAGLADGLRALGHPARTVGIDEARAQAPPDAGAAAAAANACFGSLSPHEVVLDRGDGPLKVVGLSQLRRQTGALLQAGILLALDADGLATLLARDGASVGEVADELRHRATGLADDPRELDALALVEALETHLLARATASLVTGHLDEAERVGWCRLSRTRRREVETEA